MFRLSFLLLFVAVATICCTVRAQDVVEDDDQGTRIKGGSRASQEKFPYQVSLQFRQLEYVAKKFCSGSIIGDEWILTAAHCVEHHAAYVANRKHKELYIVAGVSDAFALETAQIRLVEKVIKHPGFKVFSNYTAVHDIAVMKLKTALDFGPKVGQCELPEEDFKNEGTGVISGWGATSNPPLTHQSRDLMYANVEVVPNETCDLLNDANTQFCAGGKDVNACGGDSGGPFVKKIADGPAVCSGIISYGEAGCGNKPAVLTNVTPYVEFIRSSMEA